MRYIFATLVLVNIVYFLYANYWKEESLPAPVVTELPAGVARIELVSETEPRSVLKARMNDAITNPVREGSGSTTCNALGPLPDVFSGQALVDQLSALELSTEVRAVDRETGASDYRVMIPPVNSLEEAFRKLRELKSRDIDSYVITEGADALAISLGVFSTREAAIDAREQRLREGYDTVIVEIPRLEREFWIFGLGEDVTLQLEPALWENLQQRQEGLSRRPIPCPERTTSG